MGGCTREDGGRQARGIWCGLALLLSLPAVTPALQTTPAARLPAPATGVLSGVIVDEGGAPVPGASVQAIGLRGERTSTTSAADGRWTLTVPDEGVFRVVVQASGFALALVGRGLSPVMPWDRRWSFADLADRRLAEGDRFLLSPSRGSENSVTTLIRAGSVSGRVVDESGSPLAGVVVDVDKMTTRFPFGAGLTVTDQEGHYRLDGVAAGEHLVVVSPVPQPRTRRSGAPPSAIFYPGTADRSAARTVTVRADEHAGGIDIVVPVASRYRVVGQLSAPGGIDDLQVRILGDRGRTLRQLAYDPRDGSLGPAELAPGRYLVWARAGHDRAAVAAWLAVDVFADTELPALSLMPTGTVRGRVLSADGGLVPSNTLKVGSVLSAGGLEFEILGERQAEVQAGGTFELSGVLGQRHLVVHGAPQGWEVTDIRLARTSVMASGLDVRPASTLEGVDVILGPAR